MLCCCGEEGEASSGSGAAAAATFKGMKGVVVDVVSVAVGMMERSDGDQASSFE